ncbi:MAG: hypothetical protein M3Q50_02680, partial [Chloroflexota bacterium]|nr:hypothetical protein [Chloroflexota bacterium]
MDPSRFDTFAKSLTMTASRRRAVAGLFAGLLAPLLAKDELSAKKGKGKGKKKKKGGPPAPPPPPPTCTPACIAPQTCGGGG